ncbi:type I pantothenate kinase [Sphingobacterium hungaricum]|uniref:Pantothenate kinase n=1 Tax=Sphingobacterium hungaricum TaxID=2082723 RepID=A0A928YQB5_9SPHI|nr:type I pantothenate kinase [Sphingobacterium hungaricum]MBE8712228.1 type I pantothenate kinase [Sphingobacterium hungaricum]
MVSTADSTMSSPFETFNRLEWKNLNGHLTNTLISDDLDNLHAVNEPLTLEEIEDIYFPLAHLLHIHVHEYQRLHGNTNDFLQRNQQKLPFIIGIAGSVAVGKSTTARVLKKVLSFLPNKPKVDLVTTDGFLYPNRTLIERNILNRKGFPESYDTKMLINFLSEMKSGKQNLTVPVYSHMEYDIVENETQLIENPDILIVEGINVLQVNSQRTSGSGVFVSDFFDFSIYVDAEEKDIVDWYVNRFESLRSTAFQDPSSYFHKYADMTEEESTKMATQIWNEINRPNLLDNILPTRYRADLILFKDSHHFVKNVNVRKV